MPGTELTGQRRRRRTSTGESSRWFKKACSKCTGQPLTQSSKGYSESWEKTAMDSITESGAMGKSQRHQTSRRTSTLTVSCTASIESALGTKRIRMTSSKCSSANSHARRYQPITSMKAKQQAEFRKEARGLCASASLPVTSRKPGMTAKDQDGGAGYYLAV